MKKAFILIGASGSGKSTVRKALEEKYAGATAFSLDDTRIRCFLSESSSKGLSQGDVYKKAFDFCNKRVKTFEAQVKTDWQMALASDVVIVDNTNMTRKSRGSWVRDLKARNFEITMVVMQTPLDVIIARQKTRGDKEVPADVVKSQYMRQEEPMVGSECDKLIVVDGTKPWTA